MARQRILVPATLLSLAGATFLLPALWERPLAGATPPPARPQAAAPATASPVAPQAAQPAAPTPLEVPAAATAVALSEAISQAAEAISPSVVHLRVEARARGPRGPFEAPGGMVEGEGSGFVFRADGYILTNLHVVENATRVEARLHDGRRFVGRVVGSDPAIDLAVVKIDAEGLVPARFASSSVARVGQWVVAVGAPFGLDYTVTAGVLSAVGRANLGANEIEDYLQTDASINPGNSGGPLVDLTGQVLGINTMIIGRATGIGFAIPGDLARHVGEQIVRDGRVHRAWIGVSFQELTPELATYFAPDDHRGALVNGVVPDGPAARAGLVAGDVIVSLGHEPVADGHDLLRKLLLRPVGEALSVGILRAGQARTLALTTGERPGAQPPQVTPPAPRAPGIGLTLETLDPTLRARLRYTGPGRLVVREVLPGSAADHAGLRPGDVMLAVDRAAVSTVDEVRAQLRDGRALVEVARGDARYYAVVSSEP